MKALRLYTHTHTHTHTPILLEDKKIKVLELFAGIGACSKALDNLKIDYELVDAVEKDEHALKSFNAIHNTNFEPQDIMEWDKDVKVDLIMHGSPCQDFSVAGKGAGGDEGSGTRSSMVYESLRIIKKLKPKYVIWENVKNLLSKKHKHIFEDYLTKMSELGYINYYQILNSKDYGIPQHRERIFTVSIKKYEFPPKENLDFKLKDMLEEEVDKSYYLSEEKINKIANWKAYQKPLEKVLGQNSISPTLTARGAGEEHSGMIIYSEDLEETTNLQKQIIPIKNNTQKGYLEAAEGDGIYINTSNKRGTVQKEMIPTITSFQDKGVILKNLKVRKITPKECFRLMGFDDIDYEKASKVNSKSYLYKQAGNSIVVKVLEKVLEKLLL